MRQYNLTFSGASWSPFIVGDVGGGRNDEKLSWSEGKREFKYRDEILSRLHTASAHSAVLTLELCSVMTTTTSNGDPEISTTYISNLLS